MADHPLKTAVHNQMTASMKAGSKDRTQVLRMVLSEIKRIEADKPDADPQNAISAYAKTLRQTMGEMEKLNQPERVRQLLSELAIVEEFLPQQLDDATLDKVVSEAIAGMGPITKKDIGRAIGVAMKAAAATGKSADPAKVRILVDSKIAN